MEKLEYAKYNMDLYMCECDTMRYIICNIFNFEFIFLLIFFAKYGIQYY